MKPKLLYFLLFFSIWCILSGCQKKPELTPKITAETPAQTDDTAQSPFSLTAIDVGKGDCLLLRSRTRTVMVDCGYDTTIDYVLAFLSEQKITRLDALIITHYDKDHVGGAAMLIHAVPIDRIYVPLYEGHNQLYNTMMRAVAEHQIPLTKVKGPEIFSMDEAQCRLLPSGVFYDPEKENDNDQSLVLGINYFKDSYLLAGDIEMKAIGVFCHNNRQHFDVVKLPHHGSFYPNTPMFLASVAPKIALITDGTERPAEGQIFSLLAERGIHSYSQKDRGTVCVTGTGTGTYTVTTLR